jgi:hypothetical protein
MIRIVEGEALSMHERRRAQSTKFAVKDNRRLVALCFGISLIFSLSSCATRYAEEIVTTDASRSSAIPPGVEPIAIAPSLPTRDADLEAAGDRIAEAITYLNARRREAALHALNQAEVDMSRALRARAGEDQIRTALRTALKDLDTAEHAVQHSAPDALSQLVALNKAIDNLQKQ